MDDNDVHIWDAVVESKVTHLFVGLYGPAKRNRKIIGKALSMPLKRDGGNPLEIVFYNSESAQIWNNPKSLEHIAVEFDVEEGYSVDSGTKGI